MTFVRLRRVRDGIEVHGTPTISLGTVVDETTGDGVHARWAADANGLVAVTDPLGFYPVFLHELPDGLVVGDNIPELLSVGGKPVELDLPMVAVMLEFGSLVGERTLFGGVRNLPPNSTLRWDGSRLKIEQTRDLPGPPPSPSSRTVAVDRYIDLFRAAIERRPPVSPPVGALLSGGEDSRHIVLELVRAGMTPDCVVTASTDRRDPDLRAARALSARFGLHHLTTPHPIGGVRLESEANAATSYCANELAWMLPTVEWMRAEVGTTYDGIGGDVLSAGLYLTPRRVELAARREWREIVRDIIGGEDAAPLRSVFTPEAVRGKLPPRDETIEFLAADLASHEGAPNPIGSWIFETRTRRHMAMQPHGLLADLVAHTPYLDLELVAFLRSMPDRWLVDHRFHRDTIARAFPEVADVPYARDLARPWAEVRRAAHRRLSAARIIVESPHVWSSSRAKLLAALPRRRFKSFLAARRALTVHQATHLRCSI